MKNLVRSILNCVLPTAWVYTLLTLLYGLFAMTNIGIVRPINFGLEIMIIGIVIAIFIVAWFSIHEEWRIYHRWIIEMGSSRGFRFEHPLKPLLALKPVSMIDSGLVIAIIGFWNILAQYFPPLVLPSVYALSPLFVALIINLLSGCPDPLIDVVEEDMSVEEYAKKQAKHFGMKEDEFCDILCTENGWTDGTEKIYYAQVIWLPSETIGSVLPPWKRPVPK
ncbi:MAG: hypothetical protein HC837_12000 [Chloroflexaceae bacterium]|nr:hypothetical protein [Chloroflexaceae bacterium]